MVKIAPILVFLLLPCIGWAQWSVGVEGGPARFILNWQDGLEMKWNQPTWEVSGGWRSDFLYFGHVVPWPGRLALSASITPRITYGATFRSEEINTPFTVGSTVFGEKKGGKGGGKEKDEAIQVSLRAQSFSFDASLPVRPGLSAQGRLDCLAFGIAAQGKVDGKQVSAEESVSRWYPAVGLEYRHQYALIVGEQFQKLAAAERRCFSSH